MWKQITITLVLANHISGLVVSTTTTKTTSIAMFFTAHVRTRAVSGLVFITHGGPVCDCRPPLRRAVGPNVVCGVARRLQQLQLLLLCEKWGARVRGGEKRGLWFGRGMTCDMSGASSYQRLRKGTPTDGQGGSCGVVRSRHWGGGDGGDGGDGLSWWKIRISGQIGNLDGRIRA